MMVAMMAQRGSSIWLASRSPRRQQMLREAGIDVQVMPAAIDDGHLRPGRVSPIAWVMALAYFKARWVADWLLGSLGAAERSGESAAACAPAAGGGFVLGADTVCVMHGRMLGQPHDAADARRMLQLMCNSEHETITGVCILPGRQEDRQTEPDRVTRCRGDGSNVTAEQIALSAPLLLSTRRWLFADRAVVRVGPISDEQIEAYVASGNWRGKAGAYNLSERIEAGWPIECLGDPTTVMGLPMRRLPEWLKSAGVSGQ